MGKDVLSELSRPRWNYKAKGNFGHEIDMTTSSIRNVLDMFINFTHRPQKEDPSVFSHLQSLEKPEMGPFQFKPDHYTDNSMYEVQRKIYDHFGLEMPNREPKGTRGSFLSDDEESEDYDEY